MMVLKEQRSKKCGSIMTGKESIRKRIGSSSLAPFPLPLLLIILLICFSYRYILPLKVEVVGWESQYSLPFNETNNIIIDDFFKPYDPSNSTQLPKSTYYERINLRPLAPHKISRANFTLWLEEQTGISFNQVVDHISDSSINKLYEENVAEGAVIASPSKERPDYFYQWPRDAAITINTVISNLFESNYALNLTLAKVVVKFLNNSATLQRVPNPSGQGVGGTDPQLKGLGEPKFEVDNRAFQGNWGRPQNDGAPLRAISTLGFLNELSKEGISLSKLLSDLQIDDNNILFHDEESLFDNFIRYDLEFICENWNVDSFDLWEEVKGRHFFTSLVELSATKLGIEYMKSYPKRRNDPLLTKLQKASTDLTKFLIMEGGFLNPHKNYIVETPSNLNSRSGLDTAVLIASLLTHPTNNNNSLDLPFDVNDSGILNALHSLINSMSVIYPVNHHRHSPRMGVALGRYPEDIYDGVGTSEGNPWFLCTSSAAQLIYQLIHKMYTDELDLEIPVNTWKSQFWTSIFEGFEAHPTSLSFGPTNNNNRGELRLIIPYNSPAFHQTMISLLNYGDSFLDKLREHVGDNGFMSEQFNKYTGIMQGARDLSWSSSAFWSSSRVRKEILPLLSN